MTSSETDVSVRQLVDAVAGHFQTALRESGMVAPASWVTVSLHPGPLEVDDMVRVFVWCDQPDGQEIITVDMPHGWGSEAVPEAAHLVAAVIDTGLTRLAIARGWDLGVALTTSRAAVTREFGASARRWNVVAEGRGASAPEQPHEIIVVGGGPENGVPKAYMEELDRLLNIVAGETWRHWWSHPPVKLAEGH